MREMCCSSRLQEAASTPVIGVSGIPKGVGAEEGQLAAVLNDAAHLHHLEPVAQLRKDVLVPCIDQAPCSDLQGDVVALEAVALDLRGEVLVPLGLPL